MSRSSGNGTKSNRPVHEVRIGRIVGAIWAHEGTDDGRVWYNVTFSRIYKDGANWARSDSFGKNDLPLLIKVADRCHDWIFDQGKDDATN